MRDDLQITYWGWQGWMFSSTTTHIVVDGLLCDDIGRGTGGQTTDFMFRSERVFDFDRLPALHAWVITHEHEDHFNLPTLAQLDRRIPIYTSYRISIAARTVLEELGFSVTYLAPNRALELGDLALRFHPPDRAWGDEWDALGFSISHAASRGVFFTNVDVPFSQAMHEYCEAAERSGTRVLTFQNMSLGRLGAHREVASHTHSALEGTGYLPTQESEALAALERLEAFRLRAGDMIAISDGEIRVRGKAEYLAYSEKKPTAFVKNDGDNVSGPVCGERRLSADERSALEGELRTMAEFLYGRELYKTLCVLPAHVDIGDCKPTFLLYLLEDDDGVLAYEYSPESCSFVGLADVPENPEASYIGVVLMWASDLLALAQGRFEPRILGRSLDESWILPDFSFWRSVMWIMYHPLRFPARALEQYRRKLTEIGAVEPRARGCPR